MLCNSKTLSCPSIIRSMIWQIWFHFFPALTTKTLVLGLIG